jgi:hypothetical protein
MRDLEELNQLPLSELTSEELAVLQKAWEEERTTKHLAAGCKINPVTGKWMSPDEMRKWCELLEILMQFKLSDTKTDSPNKIT